MRDRIEEAPEAIAAAERVRNADPASGDGEDGEQHERQQHRPGALVDAVGVLMRLSMMAIGGVLGGEQLIIQCDWQDYRERSRAAAEDDRRRSCTRGGTCRRR